MRRCVSVPNTLNEGFARLSQNPVQNRSGRQFGVILSKSTAAQASVKHSETAKRPLSAERTSNNPEAGIIRPIVLTQNVLIYSETVLMESAKPAPPGEGI
jgi:hypothetical protein